MKLPQSFIDDLLARIDIVEIIGRRISLKKSGQRDFLASCPFHDEKTPSFTVSQLKQFYYCFGCQSHGSAISFLMAYDKLNFIEAVEILANQAGMEMPSHRDVNETNHFKKASDLLEKVATFYQKELYKNNAALSYLKSRGLTQDMITQFGIGFAPSGWNTLNHFSGQKEVHQQLLEYGMLIKKDPDHHFDRFRNRIMFPIRNHRGQFIGFGGRSLGKEQPKYLNSPETAVFQKSQELYGLNEVLQTHKTIKRILIVEGYMDVIALHQNGINDAVATLGTATNLQHIHRLLRYSSEIIFCFDGDRAGKLAAWRALEIVLPILRDGIRVNFMFLPNGEDPDSLVRKMGAQDFELLIEQAVSITDFFFTRLQSTCDLQSIAGKAKFSKMASQFLQKMPKGIFQQLMYEQLTQLIGIKMEQLESIMAEQRTATKTIKTSRSAKEFPPPIRLAISMLVQCPKLLSLSVIPDIPDFELPGMALLKKLITIIQQNPAQSTGSLLEYWKEPEEKNLLVELSAIDHIIPIDIWASEFQGALMRLVDLVREQQIQLLMEKGTQQLLSSAEKIKLQQLLSERSHIKLE